MADWVTVVAYLLAASLSLSAARKAGFRRQRREQLFWRIVASMLVFFAINELLDLQTLLTIAGRAHAKAYGWYGEHRAVQFAFVAGLAASGLVGGAFLLWWTRGTHGAVRLALVGLASIGVFILLRAASFHHLDDILGSGNPTFPWGSVQEMVGILLIGLGAFCYTGKK